LRAEAAEGVAKASAPAIRAPAATALASLDAMPAAFSPRSSIITVGEAA
jgi:hypothetical protein